MKRFPVIEIRSVELGTPDLAKSVEFYTKVWGLQQVVEEEDVAYLRASGRNHHVLALRAHNASEVLSVTFRVAEPDQLQQLVDSVEAEGGTVLRPVAPNDGPEGGNAVTLRTPEGYVFRLIHGDTLHESGGPRRDFPLRLAHVNLNCSDIEATRKFFEKALGFCLTDRSKIMAFLRCNQDHHVVVLADSGVDGMNHISFLMPDFESVMRGSGRMVDHGFPIGWGVGRHGPGDNIFAYFVDPSGFVIEYTAEVLQVDDAYPVRGPDYWVWPPGRTDHWGIAPAKPESVKKAQLAIRFAKNNAGINNPGK